jgi:hypothetical protein
MDDDHQILTALVLILANQIREEAPGVGAQPSEVSFVDQAIDLIKQNPTIIERLSQRVAMMRTPETP